MRQDLNPNPSACAFLVIFGHEKEMAVHFLQQVWAIFVEVKERSKMETAFTKNLDLKNLVTELLKQHWTPFSSLLRTIL